MTIKLERNNKRADEPPFRIVHVGILTNWITLADEDELRSLHEQIGKLLHLGNSIPTVQDNTLGGIENTPVVTSAAAYSYGWPHGLYLRLGEDQVRISDAAAANILTGLIREVRSCDLKFNGSAR